MDMDGTDTSTSMTMMMKPWLHFTGGDVLFFRSLAPSSGGAIAAACIVLFLIALFERGLSGLRAIMEAHWRQRALTAIASKFDKLDDSSSDLNVQLPLKTSQDVKVSTSKAIPTRRIPPFILKNDVSRGLFQALQAVLQYTLMLAVMTFHAGYITAIIVGLGVGEAVFARAKVDGESEDGAHAH
ncbi:hypothetical protein SCHPADRAFT_939933 [Schizopora paradoxa]|uniref:Copper transport protein n=1 Tax=Schizopora paradoxa TaxID=27342 RepID=A0A0H2SAQ5_9AGAM|nr:hypothetical protein SCHPADRAFT_939933 [Schizopora paradoxa]